ncbi:MAG: right-handed parallel beta-helix repeat-containing protein, partial [Planctomycetes bacterium]|nr:right-handed parallel beta-helix repeat-containing protein [Planctomycetota bacterium]
SVTPSLSVGDARVTEGNTGTSTATFIVRLSARSDKTVTVNYATADGSARLADKDYVAAAGTLTFAPGELTKTVAVTVNGDTDPEWDEDFFVNLSAPANATLGKSQGRGVIVNDDTAPAIFIDSTWLAAHGAAPYILDQAGATYVLETDVHTPGTAFVVGAAGITFDLNGYTVTYGDSASPTVRNGGFESGTGRAVPGWDLSGAPAAALAPDTSLLFGQQVLRLSNFSTAQRIVSDPIAIAQAGRLYTATITPANSNARSSLKLTVVDAVTGNVLGSASSADASRGYSAVVTFTPATTNAVRLQVDVTPPPGVSDSLDLDQATLTTSADYGILASPASSSDIPGWANLPSAARTASRKAANFTVKDGLLSQGQGDGYGSSPLFFRGIAGVTVDNIQTFATGTDTQSLDATYAKDHVTILDSTFREDIDNISNRMQNFGTLKLNNISAPIDVENNHLFGSPQAGIVLARNDPRFSVVIRNNEIRQHAVTTNAYAILLSVAQNFEIAGNTVLTTNGKGFLLDGFNGDLLGHGSIHDNYVDVQEHPNREYPTGLDAVALRLRNNLDAFGPQRDLSIHDNTFIARTGAGLLQEAFGVRISYVNNNGAMDNAGIVLAHNTIKALVTTADASYRAKALLLDRVDAGIGLQLVGNVLESNDVSLALTYSGGSVAGVDLISNTLRKSSEGASRPYTGILAGYYNREIHNVRILDTRLENGATAAIVWAGTGVKDLSVGWLLTVTARDGASNPVAGATVRVLDRDGTEVYSGTTGTDGTVHDVPVVTTVYRQTTTDPRKITTDLRGPHRVVVAYNGTTVSQDVNLTADLVLTVTVG